MTDQVDEVKQKIDIVSLIGEYVDLKKAGRNYKAQCPFHSEKTPSFMVSPELQVFKCFGCSESGDAFSFLEKYEGMDFYEALKTLAARAGVKLKPLSTQVHSEKEKLYEINRAAGYFYRWVLTSHPTGKLALTYLTRDRGISLDTIATFGLGYSPETAFALKKYLVDKKKFSLKDVEKTGIFYLKDGQMFDRFRGRVIFPLHDHRGNVVGFAGRILPKDANRDLAKYINTPETEVYHKSRILYGLNLTRADIKRSGQAVIVEGELDTISSWQVGIKNVVAIKGSALTEDQAKLLARFTKKVVLGLDTDFAGDEASRRGIQVAENEGLDVRVMRLAGYKDPDEAARANPDLLKKAIEKAVGIWDFIIESIFSRQRGQDGGEKTASISREVIPVLLAINDKILQAHYVEKVAIGLNVPVEAVTKEMERHRGLVKSTVSEIQTGKKPAAKGRRELLEERLLGLVFQNDPKLFLKKNIRKVILTPLFKGIVTEFILFYKQMKATNLKEFSANLPHEFKTGFTEIVLGNVQDLEKDVSMGYSKELELILRELNKLTIKNDREKVEQLIRELERKNDKEGLKKEQKRYDELSKRSNELES